MGAGEEPAPLELNPTVLQEDPWPAGRVSCELSSSTTLGRRDSSICKTPWEQSVRLPKLSHSPSIPAVPCVLVSARGFSGVVLENGDFESNLRPQHGGGQVPADQATAVSAWPSHARTPMFSAPNSPCTASLASASASPYACQLSATNLGQPTSPAAISAGAGIRVRSRCGPVQTPRRPPRRPLETQMSCVQPAPEPDRGAIGSHRQRTGRPASSR
jgi:hypothetical protein